MGGLADAVSDFVGAVGDLIEGVGKAAVKVVNFAVDKIIEPVVKTVGNVIQAALNDPLKTIAQVAAIATGNAWALPLIEGADVAIAGGDLSDVLEATAKAYVMQEVGSYVGKAAGSYAGQAATEAGASAASAEIAKNIVGAASGSAAVAVVTGRDPVQAFISGGVGAAVPAALGKISGFQQLPNAAQRVISAAVSAQLTGQNVTAATINSAVAASGIVTQILNSYDPQGDKLDSAQRAIITDVLMGTAVAAITGGNPSNIVQAAMVKAGSAALGQMVTDSFKTATKEASATFVQADAKASELEKNETAQKTAAANYNKYADEMRTRVDKQTELLMARTKAVEAYNANATQENYDAAQAATKTYNDHVTALNKDYAEYFKPNLDKYGGELDTLKQSHATLTSDYEKLVQAFSTKTDTLTGKLDPIYFSSNRAFVEAMSPGFNADEYRKINGLSTSEDPYEHYLAEGQFKGVPTNLKAAEAEIIAQRTRLVNQALEAKGVNLTTADPAGVSKILDIIDTAYGNDVSALRLASAQDIINRNTTTLNQLVSDQQNGVLRIDVNGTAFGAWKKPPEDKFTVPAGVRLATVDEFNNDQATLMRGDGGIPVWVVEDKTTATPVWDAATGSYVYRLSEVVITAKRPTLLDKIVAYGTDPSSWQGAVGDAILNASRTLMNWATSTNNSTIINTAANVIKAGGGFLESINGISVLAGYAPKNTSLGKFADALQSIGKAGNTAEYQAAIKNMQTMIGDAKGVGGTLKAIYGAFKSAPLEFLAEYVGVEGIQEVAPLLIGGVASAGAKGATLALKYGQAVAQKMGTAAGMTASILTDVVESAGGAASGAYDEAYRAAIKAGKSATEADKIALDIAQRSALVAAGTTAVSMGIGGAALEKALLGKTGTGMGDALQALGDFAKTGTKIAIKEGLSEAGEEGVTAAYLETQLYKLDPTRDAAANITAAAAFGAIAGGPIAGGAYGASRTGDVISNALLANPAVADTVNNAASPEAATAALRSMGVTDTATQANLLNTKYDAQYTSSDEAAAALAKRGDYVYSDADVKALTGNTSNLNLTNAVEQYVDPRVFDIAEVKAAAAAEGYTISDEDAAKLAGQKDEASATTAARAQFDPLATNYDEAKSFFTSRGYTPSADEIKQFVGSKAEADQTKAVGDYVNPRQVTAEEARKYLTDLGYKPTDAEVNRFVGQVNEASQATAISAYVDPRMVDEGEVKAAYELLGLKKPTADDIKKFVGQYAESELAGKAEAYLPTARYNSIIEQLDALAGGAGSTASKEVLDAIDTVKRDFNSQLADLGVDISKVSSEVGATKDALLTAIGDAQKGNTSRFGDIDKAIADLKAAGLTEAQVQKIVDDSSAGVSKDFKAALDAAVKGNSEELTKIKDDLTTKIGDVQTAIETKLGDQATAFNAKVQDLMDQGKTYQEATELALKDIGLKITDLGTDFATKLKATSDALGKQIGDLSTKLSDVETNLLTKIAANEKAGLSRDEATQKAVTDLATEFGVAKEDLLKQIGATETTLNERVNTLQKTFTEQVGTLETNILTKMAEYEKAGISRDEALSKAIGDVATNLGTTKESLLKQIGATEASLKEQVTNVETSLGTKITESQDAILKELGLVKTGLSEEIEGAKEAMTTALGDMETNILNRMADYEKAGISRDEALGRAVDDVATQLGTTREDILTKIGQSEAALATKIGETETALTGKIGETEQRLGTKIGDLQTTVGQKATPATQQDLDAIIKLLETQGAYDPNLDYNGDKVIDQKDKIAIETVLRSQQPDYKPDPNQPFKFLPAAGTKWAPTGIFGSIAESELATQRAIADEAARTRAAQEQAALKTQRLGNLNTMMQMLGQAGDVGGQQVTVKAADPAKIGYIYDWNSIFANPQQAQMFVTPYAQGGAVRNEMDDVNDELLKILRG